MEIAFVYDFEGRCSVLPDDKKHPENTHSCTSKLSTATTSLHLRKLVSTGSINASSVSNRIIKKD